MTDGPVLFLLLGGLILGFGAWAGWTVGARRARRPQPVPDQVWLCDACHSFNEPERGACYACHRARPAEAPTVVPDAEFRLDQQFGRVKDGGGRGASRPWLGGDEPLRDSGPATHPGAVAGTTVVAPPTDDRTSPDATVSR